MNQRGTLFPFDSDQADRHAYDVVEEMTGGVLATLRLARSLSDGERAIDLSGLDREVGLLCARALNLPEAFGRRIRVSLCTLRDELDALAHAITDPEENAQGGVRNDAPDDAAAAQMS